MNLIKSRLNYPMHVPPNCVVLFTANHTLKSNGELVMGAGAALAAKTAVPSLPKDLGSMIAASPSDSIHIVEVGDGYYGSFKTKQHFKDKSTVEILNASVDALKRSAETYQDFDFYLNYPAIGYGGLSIAVVSPIIQQLPDNVNIYLE